MDSLTILAAQLVAAKAEEEQARERRVVVEKAIEAAMPSDKLEGSTSKAIPGYKITVTRKLTRSLDIEAYMAVKDALPKGVDFVVLKPSIDTKGLRVAEKVAPEVVTACITTKPAKTAVAVKAIEVE